MTSQPALGNAPAPSTLGQRLAREMTRNWALYLMALPACAYLIIFHYIPFYGIQLAFKDFNARLGIWGSPLVGLDNFARFFRSARAMEIIWNTVWLNIIGLVWGFPLPILMALVLNQMRFKRFAGLVKTISYAPHFISTVVLVGMLYLFLSPSAGINGTICRALGTRPVLYMAEPGWFRTLYVASGLWQNTGWGMIIYLAALSGVNPELYEAARIEGATRRHCIVYIDLPTILPTVVIVLIMSMGSLMSSGFEKAFLMQSSSNLSVSELISTYVYKCGLVNADYGYSAAVDLFNNVVNFVLLTLVNAFARRVGETSLW